MLPESSTYLPFIGNQVVQRSLTWFNQIWRTASTAFSYVVTIKCLSYWVRLQGSGEENITNRILQDCWEYAKFQGRGFGWTSKERTRAYGVETITFAKATPFSSVPPWLFPEAKIDMSIVKRKKEWQINEVGIKTSMYLNEKYYNYLKMYTDGSKNKEECIGVGIHPRL